MKLSLKIHIFFMAMMAVILPAKGQVDQTATLKPKGKLTLRYPVMRGDSFHLQLSVNHKSISKTAIATNVIGAATVGGSAIDIDNHNIDRKTSANNSLIKVSAISSLTALNLLNSKSRSKVLVNVSEHGLDQQHIKSTYLERQKNRKASEFKFSDHIERDGYVTLTLSNFGNKALKIDPIVWTSPNSSDIKNMKIRMPQDGQVIVNSESPIDGDNNGGGISTYDGGTFGAVTITAQSTGETYNFYSPYASIPTSNWNIGQGNAGVDGGGSSPGTSTPAPASSTPPELKQLRTEFNKLQANKCEVRYVIAYSGDVPTMSLSLVANKDAAENYMNEHNMEEANANGISSENALKHGIMIALNYCSLGEQHAASLADLHEVCSNMNQNQTFEELVMDRRNNKIGLDIAKSQGCNDIDELLYTLHTAYVNGAFKDINGNSTQAKPDQLP